MELRSGPPSDCVQRPKSPRTPGAAKPLTRYGLCIAAPPARRIEIRRKDLDPRRSGLTITGTWLQADANGLLPEGVAYGQVYKWLVGANLGTVTCPTADGGGCAGGAGVTWTMAFTRSNGYQALAVWNEDNSSSSFSVPAQYTQYHDLTGALTTGVSGSVTITGKPLLFENKSAF